MEQRNATDLANENVRSIQSDSPLFVYPELTETDAFGWIILFGSAASSNPVAGNGPPIVDRNAADLYPLRTAYHSSDYFSNFNETGDLHRGLGRSVTLNCVRRDEHRIELVKNIRELAERLIATAKKIHDDCHDGMKPTVRIESNQIASALARRLIEVGMNVTRNHEKRKQERAPYSRAVLYYNGT